MLKRMLLLFMAVVCMTIVIEFPTNAAGNNTELEGKVYRFGEKNEYKFSKAEKYTSSLSEDNTYGQFAISGEFSDVTIKNGVPAYTVKNGKVKILYTYGDTLLNASEDAWHVVKDSGKTVDTITLGDKINKGVLILQTSTDGVNWVADYEKENVFEKKEVQTKAFYTTSEVQLTNGCYYRVIVAYKLAQRVKDNKILPDEYDYEKYAEVYKFYLSYEGADANAGKETTKLGEKIKTDNGYYNEKELNQKDVHFGWNLGEFFVSGYTARNTEDAENPIFLKNVGDKVTLWFKLIEDINCLDGKENLSIWSNEEGFDEQFEVKKTKFERGALIVKYTDYQNNTTQKVYTNYLEANTSLGADTKVQLFEEGDYEIALDYAIMNDQLIDQFSHYKICFKFSVRNGNCMVFPFDISSGEELTNSALTTNGFYLDLAKSRYLKINVQRDVLKDGVFDTRWNRPAKDGDRYTDEGMYTITVENLYTNQQTVKKIYVGENDVMRAHVVSGLSIEEIEQQIELGAIIDEDGAIVYPDDEIEVYEDETEATNLEEATTGAEESTAQQPGEKPQEEGGMAIPVIVGATVAAIVAVAVGMSRNKSKKRVDM